MQGMNKHNALITGILLAVLAGSLGCRSDAEKYEVINAFLSEIEHLYNDVDSLALYHEAKKINYNKNVLRFPVSVGRFIGGKVASYYTFYIPDEMKNGQSDKQFMLNFLTQEDITAWNEALRRNSKKPFFWDPENIKGYTVFKEPPYYMEKEFMPLEIPKGGYPIDLIVGVSEPAFNDHRDKVLLDVYFHRGPQVVSSHLMIMFKTEENKWKILSRHYYAGS